jgi:hypothetical protein
MQIILVRSIGTIAIATVVLLMHRGCHSEPSVPTKNAATTGRVSDLSPRGLCSCQTPGGR